MCVIYDSCHLVMGYLFCEVAYIRPKTNDKPFCAEHEFIITQFNFNFRILRFTNVCYTDISHYWFLKTYDTTASISKYHLYVHYEKCAFYCDMEGLKLFKSHQKQKVSGYTQHTTYNYCILFTTHIWKLTVQWLELYMNGNRIFWKHKNYTNE